MKSTFHKRNLAPLAGVLMTATLGIPAVIAPRVVAPAHAGVFSAMSEQDEIKAGQQVFQQAQKEYGRALPASDPMTRRVRAIGQRFANLSTRKNIPYSYTVLQNDKVLNAFAAPGGPVFVTTKLVRTTSNDAELAYVLGHETGHIEKKHIAQSVGKQQKAGILAGVLGAVLGRGKNGSLLGTAVNATYAVWSGGYSQKHENEADAVGTRWMSQLGYDPRAALTMLAKLDEAGGNRNGVLDKYISSHPAPKKREEKVRAQIAAENLLDVARRSGGPRLTSNFDTGSSASDDSYNNTNYPADNDYPASDNAAGDDRFPDYGDGGNTQTAINLGAPLLIVDQGDSSVIMAPVAEFGRWAGARAVNNGPVTTLQRGNYRLELRKNSTVAYANNRRLDLSVAARTYNGRFYAPLGDVVEGLGGRARFDEQLNAARISFPNQAEAILRLPR